MLNLNLLLMYLIIFSIFYNMTKIKESEIFFMIISLSYIPFSILLFYAEKGFFGPSVLLKSHVSFVGSGVSYKWVRD